MLLSPTLLFFFYFLCNCGLQPEGPEFKSPRGKVSFVGLHVLPVSAWSFCGYSGPLLQSKDVYR